VSGLWGRDGAVADRRAEELLAMPDDGFRYELVRGELRKMPPAGSEHGYIAMRLGLRLGRHAEANDLGRVYAAETGFKLASDPDTVRAPDAAFVSRERVVEVGHVEGYWPGAPDLAVEVVSPGDTHTEVVEKALAWLDAGSRMVLVVDPGRLTATVYRSLDDIRIVTEGDALDGADVLVHLALDVTPTHAEDALFARNVHGTRNVLAAASKLGVDAVVHLSAAAAYGAHGDNPVPITEDAPLRANPDYAPAYHALLAEELVGEFAEGHPKSRVAVLRAPTLLGHGSEGVFAQHLEGPRIVGIRGYHPPLQVVHVDDVAAALHLAVAADLAGPYNVAADGWLSVDELRSVLGKRLLEVPETLAFSLARQLWARGVWPAPPGLLHFLMHPLVLSSAKLHAKGWAPTRSNREVLREFAAERAGWLRFGPLRLRRRHLYATTSTGLLTAGIVLAARVAQRRRRPT
jgi:UDP-glucose 4-epimerase